jgi:Txe/YoeB family toxin of Txe-Axe toxin-antitoxin module
MIIGFADRGWEDYQYWITNDKKIHSCCSMSLSLLICH